MPSPVLLVVTPGVALESYGPLLDALGGADAGVTVVDAPCAGQDSAELADAVRRAAARLDRPVVVAHGLGATLALMADPPEVERYVLLAPVLAHLPVVDSRAFAGVPVAGPVELAGDGRLSAARDRLVGPGLTYGCAPAGFAAEVAAWAGGAPIPLDLGAVDAPVWMAVSLRDDVAGVEVVVPASRALPARTLVRLGVNRLDPRDYDHAALLLDPAPIAAAAAAVAGR